MADQSTNELRRRGGGPTEEERGEGRGKIRGARARTAQGRGGGVEEEVLVEARISDGGGWNLFAGACTYL